MKAEALRFDPLMFKNFSVKILVFATCVAVAIIRVCEQNLMTLQRFLLIHQCIIVNGYCKGPLTSAVTTFLCSAR